MTRESHGCFQHSYVAFSMATLVRFSDSRVWGAAYVSLRLSRDYSVAFKAMVVVENTNNITIENTSEVSFT